MSTRVRSGCSGGWTRPSGAHRRGCHVGRDTTELIRQAGFGPDRLERFRFPDALAPFSSHILAVARVGALDAG